MYNFGKKKNQKLMAAIVIIVVAAMPVSYTHLTLPTN